MAPVSRFLFSYIASTSIITTTDATLIRGGISKCPQFTGSSDENEYLDSTYGNRAPPEEEDADKSKLNGYDNDVRGRIRIGSRHLIATSAEGNNSMPIGGRIVGGEQAERFRYPYLVAIFQRLPENGLIHKCSGALVAERTVLSVAHCAQTAEVARIGDYSLVDAKDDAGVETVNITERIIHPDFDRVTLDFDFALFLLGGKSSFKAVGYNKDPMEPRDHMDLHVLGWGSTSADGPPSPVLREATVQCQSNEECKQTYGVSGNNTSLARETTSSNALITERMLCASGQNADACEGDSGGPLILRGNHESEDLVVGLVSGGIGCAESNHPGVYARVSSVTTWIEDSL